MLLIPKRRIAVVYIDEKREKSISAAASISAYKPAIAAAADDSLFSSRARL